MIFLCNCSFKFYLLYVAYKFYLFMVILQAISMSKFYENHWSHFCENENFNFFSYVHYP